jgi:tRNA(Ile)-lysidine synthase
MPRRKTIDWPQAAAALAARLPCDRLHPAVRAWADAAPARTKWAVGFSGGPDSLALLLLLWTFWPKRRRQLRALHFNHRLRGVEARGDVAFCRQICAALGVEFIAGEWPGKHRGASEADARRVRMAFFEQHGRVVWLGHQMDDIAEAIFMRLARGSGTGGLAAPRPVQTLPVRRVHLRPLLTLKKSEILAALRSVEIPWRVDSSNVEREFFRNRIRRDVVPVWQRAAQRDAVSGAARSRMLLEEDDAALESWLAELQPTLAHGTLSLRRLAGKPRALLRRALHRWLLSQPTAGKLSSQGFDALLAAIERGKPTRHSLGVEGFATIRDGTLRFERTGKTPRKFQRTVN